MSPSAPESPSSAGEPAGAEQSTAPGCAAIWLLVLLLLSPGNPETRPVAWAFLAAIAVTALVWLFVPRRSNTPLIVAWGVTGTIVAYARATATLDDPDAGMTNGFIWLLLSTLPFRAIVRRLPVPESAAPAPAAAPDLAGDEVRVVARLREIEAQRARIQGSRELLGAEAATPALAPVREKLAYAAGVLARQRARHVAQLWAIEAVRWQHRLEPVVASLNRPGAGSVRDRLARLAAVTDEGKRLLAALRADSDTVASFEGERCAVQLGSLLERCDQVRQGLVVQEAMLSIRGVDPADDDRRSAALSTEPLESLQTDLATHDALPAALIALELEHERLLDDDREAQDVERFLRQLEREGR